MLMLLKIKVRLVLSELKSHDGLFETTDLIALLTTALTGMESMVDVR